MASLVIALFHSSLFFLFFFGAWVITHTKARSYQYSVRGQGSCEQSRVH